MGAGLEILVNRNIIATATSHKDQFLIFDITASEDNVSIALQRLNIEDNTTDVICFSNVYPNDKVDINIINIENAKNRLLDYEEFINFIKLKEYRYLHKKINQLSNIDTTIGIQFRINDKIVKISFREDRRIVGTIIKKEEDINLSIGATDKISENLNNHIHWAESILKIGDEMAIELVQINEETPHISVKKHVHENSSTQDKLIEEYNSLKKELTKRGVLK